MKITKLGTATKKISSVKKDGVRHVKLTCDLKKLAEAYENWGNVPKSISDIRAMEIALLCRAYLDLVKKK